MALTQGQQGGRMAQRREHPLTRTSRDFETLFDRLWNGWLTPFDQELSSMRMWDFDVKENDQELTIRAELPGFEEKDLDVQIDNDVLTIRAERDQKDGGREEHRSFFRSMTLPHGIDADKVHANYRNGVLELHIPRAEGSKPRHITLKAQEAGNGREGQPASTGPAKAATSDKAKK